MLFEFARQALKNRYAHENGKKERNKPVPNPLRLVPVVNVSSPSDGGNDAWTREKERNAKIDTREGEDSEEIEPVLFVVA